MVLFKNRFNYYYHLTNISRAYFRHFFMIKICSLIILRVFFAFQKFVIASRFAIKFFFNITADFIYNLSLLFVIFNHLQSKIHPFNFTLITFYICTLFWENYINWFNFRIITHVTNEVFTFFLTMLPTDTSFRKVGFL